MNKRDRRRTGTERRRLDPSAGPKGVTGDGTHALDCPWSDIDFDVMDQVVEYLSQNLFEPGEPLSGLVTAGVVPDVRTAGRYLAWLHEPAPRGSESASVQIDETDARTIMLFMLEDDCLGTVQDLVVAGLVPDEHIGRTYLLWLAQQGFIEWVPD